MDVPIPALTRHHEPLHRHHLYQNMSHQRTLVTPTPVVPAQCVSHRKANLNASAPKAWFPTPRRSRAALYVTPVTPTRAVPGQCASPTRESRPASVRKVWSLTPHPKLLAKSVTPATLPLADRAPRAPPTGTVIPSVAA